MSPADNPVGALFDCYPTSGAAVPEIEVVSITLFILMNAFSTFKMSLHCSCLNYYYTQVNMVASQAHAPVCEGLVVAATGSSKKIAKIWRQQLCCRS